MWLHLQIIPIVDGALQEAFNVRLDELKVLDLAFLHGCAVPTLAVLFEDTKEQRHIKTYQVSLRDKVSRARSDSTVRLKFLEACIIFTVSYYFCNWHQWNFVFFSQELRDGPWSEACLDSGSSLIVPVRNTSGAVVIGEQAAVFLSATSVCSVSIKPTMVKVGCSRVNYFKFLLFAMKYNLLLTRC